MTNPPVLRKTRAEQLRQLASLLNGTIEIFDFAELSEHLLDDYFRDSTRGLSTALDALADLAGIPKTDDNFRSFLRANQLDARYIPERGLFRITRGTGTLSS